MRTGQMINSDQAISRGVLQSGTSAVQQARLKYLNHLQRLLPGIPPAVLEACSLTSINSVILTAILDAAGSVDAIALGTLLGSSSVIFAGHPGVARTLSIDHARSITGDISSRLGAFESTSDSDHRRQETLVDLTRLLLLELNIADRVTVFEGTLTDAFDAPGSPQTIRPDCQSLALVDGTQPNDLAGDLDLIFQSRPDGLILLEGVRYLSGPRVQSEVAHFLTEHPDYTFQLLVDRLPALAGCSLGVMYSSTSTHCEQILARVATNFRLSLDPLSLLQRQQELTELVISLQSDLNKFEVQEEQLGRLLMEREQLLTDRELILTSTTWRLTAPLRRLRGGHTPEEEAVPWPTTRTPASRLLGKLFSALRPELSRLATGVIKDIRPDVTAIARTVIQSSGKQWPPKD